jgi:polysaccharide biosynthesis/export protein
MCGIQFRAGSNAMETIFQAISLGVLLLSSALACVSQTDVKGANKLADSKTESPAAGSVRSAAINPAMEDFVIGAGDVLSINVWKEETLSRVIPVRSDGRISLPLVGELQASGRTPKQLETELRTKLKDFVSEPEVTVIVQEIKSQKFNVLGMVMKPGSYALANPTTVLDAIAMAGGFRDFAKQKDIYVLRRGSDGTSSRLPFNYKDVVKGRNSSQNVALQSNDTIVVP